MTLADWRRVGRREVKARPGVAGLALTDSELKQCMQKADAGDADAAYRLALHYHMYRLDYPQGEAWLVRARELGHPEARKFLDDLVDKQRRHQELENAQGTVKKE